MDTFESVAATSGLIGAEAGCRVDTTHNKQLDLLTAAADLDSVRELLLFCLCQLFACKFQFKVTCS